MVWGSWCLCVGLLVGSSNVVGAQLSKECGYASANGQAFVINGQNTSAAESPWHAGLYINGKQLCGGSLVHPRVVVTAAHCLYSTGLYGKLWNPENVKVSIGSSFREWSQEPSGHVQQRNVSKLVPHPRYRGRGRLFADDIAVLILETPIAVTAYVLPVCMKWRGSEVPMLKPQSPGRVVGWGRSHLRDMESSPVLRMAELPFIPFEQCADAVPSDFLPFLTQDKFCAGNIGGATVAQGDSGGGLVFPHKGLWFLMGVVSVGHPDSLTYSAFTNVTAYSEWIGDVLETVENPERRPSPAEAVDGKNCETHAASPGVCVPLTECPWALEEVRNRRRPKICFFSAAKPIVCCANPILNATIANAPVGEPAAAATSPVGQIARESEEQASTHTRKS